MVTKVIRTTRGLDVVTVLRLLLNTKVLVQREKPKKQTGPQLIVTRDRYTYKIDFNRKIINIRIISIKPYKEINKKKELLEDIPPSDDLLIRLPTKVSRTVKIQMPVQIPPQIPAQMPVQIPSQVTAQMPVQTPTQMLDARYQMPRYLLIVLLLNVNLVVKILTP